MKATSEEKHCIYCRFANDIFETEDMLCDKNGVVPKEYVCRKFVYDPLKRVPRRPPKPEGSIDLPEI